MKCFQIIIRGLMLCALQASVTAASDLSDPCEQVKDPGDHQKCLCKALHPNDPSGYRKCTDNGDKPPVFDVPSDDLTRPSLPATPKSDTQPQDSR
jgi:hypothetical protein